LEFGKLLVGLFLLPAVKTRKIDCGGNCFGIGEHLPGRDKVHIWTAATDFVALQAIIIIINASTAAVVPLLPTVAVRTRLP
jgi:hypothetical protein